MVCVVGILAAVAVPGKDAAGLERRPAALLARLIECLLECEFVVHDDRFAAVLAFRVNGLVRHACRYVVALALLAPQGVVRPRGAAAGARRRRRTVPVRRVAIGHDALLDLEAPLGRQPPQPPPPPHHATIRIRPRIHPTAAAAAAAAAAITHRRARLGGCSLPAGHAARRPIALVSARRVPVWVVLVRIVLVRIGAIGHDALLDFKTPLEQPPPPPPHHVLILPRIHPAATAASPAVAHRRARLRGCALAAANAARRPIALVGARIVPVRIVLVRIVLVTRMRVAGCGLEPPRLCHIRRRLDEPTEHSFRARREAAARDVVLVRVAVAHLAPAVRPPVAFFRARRPIGPITDLPAWLVAMWCV